MKCSRALHECLCPLAPGHEGIFQRWVERNKAAYRQARTDIETKLAMRKLAQKTAEKASTKKQRQMQLFDPAASMHLAQVAQQLGLQGETDHLIEHSNVTDTMHDRR